MSEEKGVKPESAAEAVPEPAAGNEAGWKLRPEMEALREHRLRRMRLTKRVLIALVGLGVLVMVALIFDWYLLNAFRDRYDGQAWIEIFRVYDDIEKGMILEVHEERVMKDLEGRFLGREVLALGRLTGLEPAGKGAVEVLVDVPHFEEVVNFYKDDVHVDLPLWAGPFPEKGEWVMARGTVTSFSKFRLRLNGTSLRPLSSLEKFYMRRVMPPKSLTREPIGFNRFLK